jgi:hypothetical protein
MSKYEGLCFNRKSKNWKAFREFFPNKTGDELEKVFIDRIEYVFNREGIELDSDLYLETIGKIVADMKWHPGAFCLKILRRWTPAIEKVFLTLEFRGYGQCKGCGADDFEDYDYGDHGEVEHICGVCEHRQIIED